MKIKSAYYIKQLPAQMAVEMDNGEIMVTNLSPIRAIGADQLQHIAAFDKGYWMTPMMDKIPDYIIRHYGLEIA